MNDPADDRDLLLAEEPPAPRKKGRPVVAWVVIVLLVALILLRPWLFRPPLGAGATAPERMESAQVRLMGRYLVGAAHLLPLKDEKQKQQLDEQARNLNTGDAGERLRAIVVIGDLDGPQAALDALQDLSRQLAANEVPGDTPEARALADMLDSLYRDYAEGHLDALSVKEEQRARLREELGWFGQLALAPEDGPDPAAREAVLQPARGLVAGVLAGFAVVGLLGLAGFTGLVLFLVMLFQGRLRTGIGGAFTYGRIYAETFAVWMLLFIALQFAAGFIKVPGVRLLPQLAAEFLSLAALAWPVLRGVPWRKVRQDVGWTAGRSPALEPMIGLGCNLMSIPALAVGVLIFLGLMALQKRLNGGRVEMPTHPVVQLLGSGDWRILVQLLILASVGAPLIEETMFRGVLYRHMREASVHFGRTGSILCSAVAVSFLFAVIHPQGWMVVPPLMALAFVFNLVREWRGTLIPSMVAHGVHNGLLVLLGFFLLGG